MAVAWPTLSLVFKKFFFKCVVCGEGGREAGGEECTPQCARGGERITVELSTFAWPLGSKLKLSGCRACTLSPATH